MKPDLKNLLENGVRGITWKDAAVFAATAVIVYLVYIIMEYWPEIMQGFQQGWNSRQ